MKCPYINPTVSQCEQCPFPDDCVRDEKQDHNDYNREWNHNHPDRVRATLNRYKIAHPDRNKQDCIKYYNKIKDTMEYKDKKHEYYMSRKDTPEYRASKKESNRRYLERLRERQAG
jgi:hypothetical protein